MRCPAHTFITEDPDASSPCLFGDDPNRTTPDRLILYPKPAYYGLRHAITNYFGYAFSVKGARGQETLRFVENGNVLLMKERAAVHTGVRDWSSLFKSRTGGPPRFIVKNATGVPIAVLVSSSGHLYLTGEVFENQSQPLDTGTAAFKVVRRTDGAVVSMIDDQGNLRMTGYLLIYGIPYNLGSYTTDHYFAW